MKDIQMVDLVSQYNKIKDEVDAAILEVVSSAYYINGPIVNTFSKKLESYLNVKHVIPCANGTDALQIAMMALGLKPGDEVITADFTFIATVEVIALLGLKPVLVDVDPKTYLIDPREIEKVITPRTKAIVPVHLFGQCANMDEILAIAKKYNLYVIEDTAQAIGSDFAFVNGEVKKAGTIGDFGCTSFFPSKNLGCFGDGGALFTDNDDFAEKARMIVNHGMKERYYHDEVGVNSRLDSIQAAILNIKLDYLDKYNESRRKVADYYDSAFCKIKDLEIPFRSDKSTHIFHQYTIRVKNGKRDSLQKYLSEKKIPAMIYYPVPPHSQKAYQNLINKSNFPVTDILSEEVLSLPMHTEMCEEHLKYITYAVIEFFNM